MTASIHTWISGLISYGGRKLTGLGELPYTPRHALRNMGTLRPIREKVHTICGPLTLDFQASEQEDTDVFFLYTSPSFKHSLKTQEDSS